VERAGQTRKARTKATGGAGRDNIVHLRTRSPVQGFHVLAEWYGCPRSDAIRRAEHLRQTCIQLVREAGGEVVSSLFQQFEPDGVVGTVLLSDAHIAVHTWPETGLVTIDFYACHVDPSSRARAGAILTRLREVLRPVWVNATEVQRGVADRAPAVDGR